MSLSRWKGRLAFIVTCVSLFGLWGCELGQSLREIGEAVAGDQRETIDGEGGKVIEGSYRALRFDGNNADGAFIVAIETTDEEEPESLLSLIPFPEAEGKCDAGPALRYATAVSRPGNSNRAGEARVPFLAPPEEEDGSAILRFTNFRCDVDRVNVPGGSLPINSTFTKDPGLIVQTDNDELFWVSPWTDERRRIADIARVIHRDQRAMFAPGDGEEWMWTIEHGEIVVRNAELSEVGRLGENVDQVLHNPNGNGGPMIAFHQSTGEVRVAYAADLRPSTLESDGCNLQFGSGNDGPRLIYYSPCAEQNVVAYELETDQRRELAQGVAGFRMVGDRSDGPVVLYITNDTGSGSVGTLWARFGEETPVKVGENGHIGLTRLVTSGDIEAVLDWGANGGRLVTGRVDEELEEIVTDVVYIGSVGIIADWDGELGTLYRLDNEDKLERIQRRVTTRGLRHDSPTKRSLLLVDFDGTQGDLVLVRQNEQSGQHNTTLMSENVRPDSYQFTVQLPTVTILSDLDEETGTATLKLRRVSGDDETIVSDGVSETLEVSWPKSGMLYSIPVGDRAGAWFTETR